MTFYCFLTSSTGLLITMCRWNLCINFILCKDTAPNPIVLDKILTFSTAVTKKMKNYQVFLLKSLFLFAVSVCLSVSACCDTGIPARQLSSSQGDKKVFSNCRPCLNKESWKRDLRTHFAFLPFSIPQNVSGMDRKVRFLVLRPNMSWEQTS